MTRRKLPTCPGANGYLDIGSLGASIRTVAAQNCTLLSFCPDSNSSRSIKISKKISVQSIESKLDANIHELLVHLIFLFKWKDKP